MQSCPQLYGFGYSNPTQFLPCTPVTPSPEIIGEGEVVSVILSDGSVQFIFLPITKRWPNYACNENLYSTYWGANTGVWLVRSFSKQIPQAVFNPCWQPVTVDPFSNVCFNSKFNLNEPGFQLKFHNDSWTSTTDLHYFFPYIRKYNWPPPLCAKESVSVQVAIPTEQKSASQNADACNNQCHCELSCKSDPAYQNTKMCSKCCHCAHCVETKNNGTKSQCSSENIKKHYSDMSIDSKPKKSSKPTKSRKKSSKKKSSKGVRICDSPCTMNKSVATYVDEACGNDTDKHQTKIWSCDSPTVAPVRTIRRKSRRDISSLKSSIAMESQSSERLLGTYETCSCTSSICDCDTDPENL